MENRRILRIPEIPIRNLSQNRVNLILNLNPNRKSKIRNTLAGHAEYLAL